MRFLFNPERQRSRQYRRLHADPAIRRATHFFAAAAEVTRLLARRRLSPFLRDLGRMLETANIERARQISAGDRYTLGCARDNTADFIHYEQQLVQDALDALQARDAVGYRNAVLEANRELARAGTLLVRVSHPVFARAAAAVRRDLARPLDFAQRRDRELLGNAIAREACPEPGAGSQFS